MNEYIRYSSKDQTGSTQPKNYTPTGQSWPGRCRLSPGSESRPAQPSPSETMAAKVPHSAHSQPLSSESAGSCALQLPAPPSDAQAIWPRPRAVPTAPPPKRRKWGGELSRALSVGVCWSPRGRGSNPGGLGWSARSGSAVRRAPWMTRVNRDGTDLLGLSGAAQGSVHLEPPSLGSRRGHFPSSGCWAGGAFSNTTKFISLRLYPRDGSWGYPQTSPFPHAFQCPSPKK